MPDLYVSDPPAREAAIGDNGPPIDLDGAEASPETPAEASRLADLITEADRLLAGLVETAEQAKPLIVVVKQITKALDAADKALKTAQAPHKAAMEAEKTRFLDRADEAEQAKAKLLRALGKAMERLDLPRIDDETTNVKVTWRTVSPKGAEPTVDDAQAFCDAYPWLTKTVPDMALIKAELAAGRTLQHVTPPHITGRVAVVS